MIGNRRSILNEKEKALLLKAIAVLKEDDPDAALLRGWLELARAIREIAEQKEKLVAELDRVTERRHEVLLRAAGVLGEDDMDAWILEGWVREERMLRKTFNLP